MEDRSETTGIEEAAGFAQKERLREAQEMVARHVKLGAMLSEELIAERRPAALEE
jgi:hypothetical protein